MTQVIPGVTPKVHNDWVIRRAQNMLKEAQQAEREAQLDLLRAQARVRLANCLLTGSTLDSRPENLFKE